jgi:hypothetical protein
MKASTIVNKALSYVGVTEKYNNNVKFNTDYYGIVVSGAEYRWCMTFVWDIFRECGASALFYGGKKTASCTTLMKWAKSVKKWHTNGFRPGDVVLYNFDKIPDADHVGIVYKVYDGYVMAIEGNTSPDKQGSQSNGGMVCIKKRTSDLILGVYRPDYDADTGTVIPANPTLTADAKKKFIRSVQKACGAKVDGIAGPETLSKTVTLSAKKNRKHAAVKAVQVYLNKLGYVCGTPDGIAGPLFTNAVKSYQKMHGCVVDGEITARCKTWKKLLGLIK